MAQMCPNCSRDNADNAQGCINCQEQLLDLLGQNTMLDNRYQVTGVLGCGGFGAVYLAQDKRIQGRQVAVKENRPDPQANPQAVAQARQQFKAEVNVMINLHHAGLPNVSDQFTASAGRQYMVMDYVEGETLDDIIDRRKSLPEAEVVDLAGQLLDILEHLHRQQPPVIHRDVKPANIKQRPDGQIVLVDFGISKLQGQGTQSWAKSAGTPGFAPLEQYGRGTTAAYSDIYSLGAVIYYLLTGKVPSTAPDLAAGAPLTPPRKLKPQLSLKIQRVVFKAMAINVNERYQSVAEMRQALLGGAGQPPPPPRSKPVTPPPPQPVTPSPPAAKPNYPAWFAAAGGIGVTLICLILGLVVILNSEILSPTPTSTPTPRGGTISVIVPRVESNNPSATPTERSTQPPGPTWTATSTPPPGPTWTSTPTPEPADTWTPAPTPTSTPTATATPDYEATVEAVVRQYSNDIKIQNVTHLDSSGLTEVLIDPVLEKQKRSACWLSNEGLYYDFSNRSFVVNSTNFESNDHATVLAQIKENRKLIKQNGEVHRDYGYDDYRAIYQLQRKSDGKWYIYCLQALDDGDPSRCEVEIEGENPCR